MGHGEEDFVDGIVKCAEEFETRTLNAPFIFHLLSARSQLYAENKIKMGLEKEALYNSVLDRLLHSCAQFGNT